MRVLSVALARFDTHFAEAERKGREELAEGGKGPADHDGHVRPARHVCLRAEHTDAAAVKRQRDGGIKTRGMDSKKVTGDRACFARAVLLAAPRWAQQAGQSSRDRHAAPEADVHARRFRRCCGQPDESQNSCSNELACSHPTAQPLVHPPRVISPRQSDLHASPPDPVRRGAAQGLPSSASDAPRSRRPLSARSRRAPWP